MAVYSSVPTPGLLECNIHALDKHSCTSPLTALPVFRVYVYASVGSSCWKSPHQMGERGLYVYFKFGFLDCSTLEVYVYKKENPNNGTLKSLEDCIPEAMTGRNHRCRGYDWQKTQWQKYSEEFNQELAAYTQFLHCCHLVEKKY